MKGFFDLPVKIKDRREWRTGEGENEGLNKEGVRKRQRGQRARKEGKRGGRNWILCGIIQRVWTESDVWAKKETFLLVKQTWQEDCRMKAKETTDIFEKF